MEMRHKLKTLCCNTHVLFSTGHKINDENNVVYSVSRNGVFCRRMLSPIGMNAHFVCEFYDVSMCDISVISESLAWSVHNDKVIALHRSWIKSI